MKGVLINTYPNSSEHRFSVYLKSLLLIKSPITRVVAVINDTMNIGFVGPIIEYIAKTRPALAKNNKPGISRKSRTLSSERSGIKSKGARILKIIKYMPVFTVDELAIINITPAVNIIGELRIIIPRIKIIRIAPNWKNVRSIMAKNGERINIRIVNKSNNRIFSIIRLPP